MENNTENTNKDIIPGSLLWWEILRKLQVSYPLISEDDQDKPPSFEHVRSQQREEIEYCKQAHPDLAQKFLKDCEQPTEKIEELLYRHTCLDELNNEIIDYCIRNSKENTFLDLSGKKLTRLPAIIFANLAYWKNVLSLDCSNNRLLILPPEIKHCLEIQWMNCSHNHIKLLPRELKYCTKLRTFKCSHNQLRSIPSSIISHVQFSWLDCSYNELKMLPSDPTLSQDNKNFEEWVKKVYSNPPFLLSFRKYRTIQFLDCRHNHLQSLPLELRAQLGKQWEEESLSLKNQTGSLLQKVNSFLPSSSSKRTIKRSESNPSFLQKSSPENSPKPSQVTALQRRLSRLSFRK